MFSWTLPGAPWTALPPKQPGDGLLSQATGFYTEPALPMYTLLPCCPRVVLGGRLSLTILHLGPKLALLGIFKDRVMAGFCAFHSTVTAGLVKEGSISTWRRAANKGIS